MPLQKLAQPLLSMPRAAKRSLVLAVDVSLCLLTVWVAFYLRLEQWLRFTGDGFYHPFWAALVSVAIALPLFIRNGFYRVIFRHSELAALGHVLRAFGLYALFYFVFITVIGLPGVPRSVGVVQPLLLILAVGASRALARFWLGGAYQNIFRRMSLPKSLVYGAGNTGRELAAAMANSTEMQVAGFVDDNPALHGHVLNGVPIYGPKEVRHLVSSLGVTTVLLAMPSITRTRRNAILAELRPLKVAVRTLPSLTDLAQGRVTVSELRDLDIDDLLGREPVEPNPVLLAKNIGSQTVLVTGAGGSIGSELCRQILTVGPSRLLLVEQSEWALYNIHQELQARCVNANIELVPLLASVQDVERMTEIMGTWQPSTVYHAAAYKHVPLVEHNPAEGVKNNVLGTLRTAQVAAQQGVSNFVLISTDKAVRPTNIMGASKRLAEMVLQALAQANAVVAAPGGRAPSVTTTFSMVRFGNVLGSSGSVVPKFRQQIRDGGPITLTHPEVTRYFMTIPEAAQLVIQAAAMAKGGDVFVLDMGQPVKIIDLARRMVELSGLTVKDESNPEGDIDIQVTGLRPGEKLYEELLIGNNPQPTLHARIMKAHEDFLPWDALEEHLRALEMALNVNDVPLIQLMMQKLVPGYQPNERIVDWVYLQQEAVP